jgi:DNA-binding MarR family transcriptional regulator
MTEPRWLDDEEQRAWRGFLRCYAEVRANLQRQLQRDTDLSHADYEVLVALSEAEEGRMRAFQLSDAIQWEKSRLSHQIDRMAKRGLVARQQCPTDARGAFIVITDEGRRAIEAAAPLHVEEVRRVFFDHLDRRQVAALADACHTVLDGIAALEGSPGRTGESG